MFSLLRPAFVLFGALTLIVGLLYPLLVTAIGETIFPYQVGGSLIQHQGRMVGSSLIGQSFTSPQYFQGRPSATGPMSNNASGSGGSNLGPTNPALIDAVQGRADALRALDPSNKALIPVDLVTASASGLDPDISVAAALYQAGRVARARHVAPERVLALIEQQRQRQHLGFIGEPSVNVLKLNLALDLDLDLAPNAAPEPGNCVKNCASSLNRQP
jgi:K+-transporting ATPase ATPase C chain